MARLTVADVPHMLKMWDHELNIEKPEDVFASCTDPKYWKCPDCGYEWSVPPKTRFRGSGKCPCHESNKAIRKGVNDVLTIVKGLDTFLDEDNNFEEIYTQGTDSSLSVNFKCDECGRKWTATLRSQIKKETNGSYRALGCSHLKKTRRKKDEIPLCSEVEAIFKFWDDNNSLDPTTTRSNSDEKAHFICKNCGYDWTITIRAQGRGSGKCKCCEQYLVPRKGFSDVFTRVPASKDFFDFNKNKDIDIYSLPITDSKTQIDWKCPTCEREWSSPLGYRIRKKDGVHQFTGCQECYFNDKSRITPVASIPKLLKFWDFEKNKELGLDPNLTSAYANTSAHWKCKKCDYQWETYICTRTSSDGKCPFCEGKSKPVRTGINDVLTLCEGLGEIYDFERNEKEGIDIYKESVYSRKRAYFKCKKCGHKWDSIIENRVKKNPDGTYTFADCPECSNGSHRQIPYSEEYPLLAQMYRNDLNAVSLDSIKGRKAVCEVPYYWTCTVCEGTFDSTLESMLNSQKHQTKGCPYCSRTRLREGESFAELHPELMDEYAPTNTIDPYKTFPNNKEQVNWICRECGYKWEASFVLRHKGTGNCPVCNRTILVPDKNSLAALYPDIARRWSPNNAFNPDTIFPSSWVWVKWICDVCNGEYNARVKDVVDGTDECPYCKGTKVLPGFNSFADRHSDLLNEMDKIANYLLPKSPFEVLDTSHYKFWWICKNDPQHKYTMSPRDRLMFQKRERQPCLYCRGQRRKLNRFIPYKKP